MYRKIKRQNSAFQNIIWDKFWKKKTYAETTCKNLACIYKQVLLRIHFKCKESCIL